MFWQNKPVVRTSTSTSTSTRTGIVITVLQSACIVSYQSYRIHTRKGVGRNMYVRYACLQFWNAAVPASMNKLHYTATAITVLILPLSKDCNEQRYTYHITTTTTTVERKIRNEWITHGGFTSFIYSSRSFPNYKKGVSKKCSAVTRMVL